MMLGFDDAGWLFKQWSAFRICCAGSQTAPRRKVLPERKEYTLAVNNGRTTCTVVWITMTRDLWNAKEEAENAVTFTF